jgi:anaerobic ribonucleoside-triphosphate reductase
MKPCIDGSKTHEHCEDINIDETIYVVCHDCKQTLGKKCEVYSRVCGYLRPTAGWNPGKQAEHSMRKSFLVPTPH